MLRKVVAALILVPLAVVLIAFAVANRQPVTLSLDPFASGAQSAFTTPPLPLFLVLLAVLIVGVLIGGIAGWLRHGGWRRTARRLEREIARLHAELETHRRAAGLPRAPAVPPAPVGTAAEPERLQLKPPGT